MVDLIQIKLDLSEVVAKANELLTQENILQSAKVDNVTKHVSSTNSVVTTLCLKAILEDLLNLCDDSQCCDYKVPAYHGTNKLDEIARELKDLSRLMDAVAQAKANDPESFVSALSAISELKLLITSCKAEKVDSARKEYWQQWKLENDIRVQAATVGEDDYAKLVEQAHKTRPPNMLDENVKFISRSSAVATVHGKSKDELDLSGMHVGPQKLRDYLVEELSKHYLSADSEQLKVSLDYNLDELDVRSLAVIARGRMDPNDIPSGSLSMSHVKAPPEMYCQMFSFEYDPEQPMSLKVAGHSEPILLDDRSETNLAYLSVSAYTQKMYEKLQEQQQKAESEGDHVKSEAALKQLARLDNSYLIHIPLYFDFGDEISAYDQLFLEDQPHMSRSRGYGLESAFSMKTMTMPTSNAVPESDDQTIMSELKEGDLRREQQGFYSKVTMNVTGHSARPGTLNKHYLEFSEIGTVLVTTPLIFDPTVQPELAEADYQKLIQYAKSVADEGYTVVKSAAKATLRSDYQSNSDSDSSDDELTHSQIKQLESMMYLLTGVRIPPAPRQSPWFESSSDSLSDSDDELALDADDDSDLELGTHISLQM